MTPDLPYYLPFSPGWPTHAVMAVGSIDVLLGLAAWLAWHGLLAAPAVAFAPDRLRARLVDRVEIGLRSRLGSVRQVLLLLLALAVGAGTHVLWDEFTHPNRWGTEHLSVLASTWGGIEGYRWLQHGSGLAGAAALTVWLLLWWRRTEPVPVRTRPAAPWLWAGLLVVGAIAGSTAAVAAPTLRSAGFDGATRGGAAVLLAAVVLALAWHLDQRADRPEPS